MAGIETILKAADLIAEIRRAFSKIENLEAGQRQLADALRAPNSGQKTANQPTMDAVSDTHIVIPGRRRRTRDPEPPTTPCLARAAVLDSGFRCAAPE